MNKLASFFDLINEQIGRVIAWLTLFMVLITFLVVVLRYGFNWGSIAMQESVIYLHALAFMAAAAYTLRHDEHVRVDIFYGDMPARKKAWVDILGTLFLLIPFCLFMLWTGWFYVSKAWAVFEGSPEAGGLPLVFILKSFILLMAVLLLLQAFSLIVRNLQIIREEN